MTTTMTRPETVEARPSRSRMAWLAALAAILLVAVGFGAGFLTSQVTEDFVFTAIDPYDGSVIGETIGVDAFYDRIGQTDELRATSEVVQEDDGLVSTTYSEGESDGLLVFEVVGGKIAHTWVFLYPN